MRGIGTQNREDELIGILQDRRAETDTSVVKFEVATSRTDQPILVVPRISSELLPESRTTNRPFRS